MCGGAVVEAATDVQVLLGPFAVLSFEAPPTSTIGVADRAAWLEPGDFPDYSAGNHGRYLRALHGSLLC